MNIYSSFNMIRVSRAGPMHQQSSGNVHATLGLLKTQVKIFTINPPLFFLCKLKSNSDLLNCVVESTMAGK